MPSYLVEVYMPRSRPDDALAAGTRATAIAAAMALEGTPVRHLRTTFLPDDKTCFDLVEAESPEVVSELSRRARLGRARGSRAVEASRSRRPPAR